MFGVEMMKGTKQMLRALVFTLALMCVGERASADVVPFALRFIAMHGADPVGCESTVSGLGPNGDVTIGVSDLRFYVSDVVFHDADGMALSTDLTPSPFQLVLPAGSVALVDLTDASKGACAPGSISFGEGTERTNDRVIGTHAAGKALSVSFRVGVPQPLMQAVIASTSAEDAPSPLREMHWNWAGGYRHFVLNHTVDVSDGRFGEGYVHIGSMDCGPAEGKALSDRERCGLVYTPAVRLAVPDAADVAIAIDLAPLFGAVDFVAPVYDPETFAVIGERPGTDCHSSTAQPDCALILPIFGLDLVSGGADPGANQIFRFAR